MSTLRDVLTLHLEYSDMRDVIFATKIDGKFTLDSFAAVMPKHWHNEDSDSVEFASVASVVDAIDDYLFDDSEYLKATCLDGLSATQCLIDSINYDNELSQKE